MKARDSKIQRFRSTTVVAEAVRNLISRPVLSCAIALLSAGTMFASIALTALETNQILSFQTQLEERGIYVQTVAGTAGTPISATRCESLNMIEGVKAAGGLVGASSVRLLSHPSVPVSIVRATPNYASIIWPETRSMPAKGLIVGAEIAAELGLVPGAGFVRGGTDSAKLDASVASVAKPSMRDGNFDAYVVEPVSPRGQVRSCLVEAEPGAYLGVQQLLTTWFSDEVVSVSPLYALPKEGLTPQQQMQSRLSQYFPFGAILLVTCAAVASWLIRRKDFALYRLLGMPPRKLFTNVFSEWLLTVMLPSSAGAVFAMIAVAPQLSGIVLEAAVLDAARLFALIWLVPCLGLLLVGGGSPLAVLRGKD